MCIRDSYITDKDDSQLLSMIGYINKTRCYKDSNGNIIPVSYTHLDVYKRQLISLILILNIMKVHRIITTIEVENDNSITFVSINSYLKVFKDCVNADNKAIPLVQKLSVEEIKARDVYKRQSYIIVVSISSNSFSSSHNL